MEIKLVAEWRQAWRWASVRLAAIVAVMTGVLTANPEILLGLIGMLPHGTLRIVLAVGVGIVVFGLPTLTRITKKASAATGAAALKLQWSASADGRAGWHSEFCPGDGWARTSIDNGQTWSAPFRAIEGGSNVEQA